MTPPPPPVPPAGASPLAEADFQMLRRAAAARKTVRRAANVAATNAVLELGIGILALGFTAFFWSWTNLAVALALCVVGVVEFVGHDRLRASNPAAARILGLNQLALLAVIIVYCVLRIAAYTGPEANQPVVPEDMRAQLRDLGITDQDLGLLGVGEVSTGSIARVAYGAIIALSVVFQGLMSLYYFTRRRHIEAFRAATPQ